MSTTDISFYTALCLCAGIVVSVALRVTASDQIEAWFGPLFFSLDHWEPGISSRITLVTFLGAIGLGTMWLSSRLDFVDPKDDFFPLLIICICVFAVICWTMFWLFGWAQRTSYGEGLDPSHWRDQTLLQSLVSMIAGLIGLVLFLPFWLLWVLYPIVLLGAFLGAVFCLPRALIFAVTRHSLRDAWEKGKRSGLFDSDEIRSGLGKASKSSSEARAAFKDSRNLLDETRAELKRLMEEFEQLSKNVKDDAERFKTEAEIARVLAEIEDVKIKINVLKEHLGRSRGTG